MNNLDCASAREELEGLGGYSYGISWKVFRR